MALRNGLYKPAAVFLDRDGTINADNNYYLGSDQNWQSQVEFLPGVVEGIKLMNSLNIVPAIVTNQSGVALDLLTEKRVEEVNRHIIEKLRTLGANVNRAFTCPFVDNAYVKKAIEKGRKVNPKYIRNDHPDLKPSIGLIEKAIQSRGRDLSYFEVYVIGDRDTDVQMGLNAGGYGILVASSKTKELGDLAKVEQLNILYPGKAIIVSDFHEAARRIEELQF